MTAVLLISAMGGGGVAFMVHFFIALCKETKKRSCHVVRLPPDSRWKLDPEFDELRSGAGTVEGQKQQVASHRRQVFGG